MLHNNLHRKTALYLLLIALNVRALAMAQPPPESLANAGLEAKRDWLSSAVELSQRDYRDSVIEVSGTNTVSSNLGISVNAKEILFNAKYSKDRWFESRTRVTELGTLKTDEGYDGKSTLMVTFVDGKPDRAVTNCDPPRPTMIDPNLHAGIYFCYGYNFGKSESVLAEFVSRSNLIEIERKDDGDQAFVTAICSEAGEESKITFATSPALRCIRYERSHIESSTSRVNFETVEIEYDDSSKQSKPQKSTRSVGSRPADGTSGTKVDLVSSTHVNDISFLKNDNVGSYLPKVPSGVTVYDACNKLHPEISSGKLENSTAMTFTNSLIIVSLLLCLSLLMYCIYKYRMRTR